MGLFSRKTNLGNYWSPHIQDIIRGDNVTEKMIRANLDALRAGNYRAWLWQSRETGDLCSCVRRVAGESHDTKCLTCYGTGKLGGYERYGFDTQFFTATKTDDLTVVNLEKDLQRTPNRLRLKSNETSGYIETSQFEIHNELVAPIEWRLDTYSPEPTKSFIVIKFAVNNDIIWKPISELQALVMRHGYLRFKVEIARDTTNVRSPQFEIFRIRNQNARDALLRISRNVGSRRRDRQAWGDTENESGLRFWMGPSPILRAFLEPLNEDGSGLITNLARMDSQRKGIDPFFEVQTGSRKGERYLITTISRSEPLGRLISQRLTVRILQPDEIAYSVF